MAQWGSTALGVLNAPTPPQLPPSVAGMGSGRVAHPHVSVSTDVQQARMCNLLVTGGKDGSLALVDISSGKVGGVRGWLRALGSGCLGVGVVSKRAARRRGRVKQLRRWKGGQQVESGREGREG